MPSERQVGDARVLRIAAFPDDRRLRRIAWFGPIRFVNRMIKTTEPSVLVSLSEILDSSVRSNPDALISPDAAAPRQLKRWVSVGTTVLLRIGDLWEGQRWYHRPALETEHFEDLLIDETTATVVKAGSSHDDGSSLIPFSEHPWHSEDTHSYCARILLTDGRRLVIPAMELIHFYFGSSAKLLSLLFRPLLTREALYERVRLPGANGHMILDLARGISRASAEDIARIAGDRNAWAAALLVGTSCLKASTKQEDIYPVAHFPFVGRTDLRVHGHWLSHGSETQSTFLAYRIASCSHAFPFRSLTFKLTGQTTRYRRPHDYLSGPEGRNSTYRTSPATLPDQRRIEERDPSAHLAPATYNFHNDRTFPYLEGRFIRNTLRMVSADAALYGPNAEAVSGLAVGEFGSSMRLRQVLLLQTETESHQSIPAFLKPAIAAFGLLSEMEVHLLTGSAEDGWTHPILLPLDEDGVIDDAFLVEAAGHTRPRRFAAFRINKGGDRLIVVFIESAPLFPLAYPSERADEDEAQDAIVCAAQDFLRRMRGTGAPDLTITTEDISATIVIRDWIFGFF